MDTLTIPEAVLYYRKDRATIYRYIKKGWLKVAKRRPLTKVIKISRHELAVRAARARRRPGQGRSKQGRFIHKED